VPSPAPVDVIVPVYRGLGDTRCCIESVLSSPVRTAFRLVLINDCSPEPEVSAYLRTLPTRDARVLLLENEQNLGFVGTVNRGMALDGARDVLLLNSDAEVANDWLDRIRAAAYSGRVSAA
jgi:GT2 family glycosyltransferase